MDGFLLALLLVFALALGGRDQWLVAQWSEALGQSAPLLLTGIIAAALSAAAMAWVGAEFAALLPRRAAPRRCWSPLLWLRRRLNWLGR